MLVEETKARIESELEVKAYIQDLKFSLNNGAQIDFQVKRVVDEKRDEKYTNPPSIAGSENSLRVLLDRTSRLLYT